MFSKTFFYWNNLHETFIYLFRDAWRTVVIILFLLLLCELLNNCIYIGIEITYLARTNGSKYLFCVVTFN